MKQNLKHSLNIIQSSPCFLTRAYEIFGLANLGNIVPSMSSKEEAFPHENNSTHFVFHYFFQSSNDN